MTDDDDDDLGGDTVLSTGLDQDTVLATGGPDRDDTPIPVRPTPRPITPRPITPHPITPATPPQRPSRPPAAPQRASRPPASTEIAPMFRKDLQLTGGADGYTVRDPRDGRTLSLNEYEVSLARMLDGRRPLFEIVGASDRLGIPINLESLRSFIDRLGQAGLLGPPESLDAAVEQAMGNVWPSRGEWGASVRTLFQSGIRMLRMGKPGEAANYFEAMLHEDPDNIEARELLEMARQQGTTPATTAQIAAVVPMTPIPPASGGFSNAAFQQPYPDALAAQQPIYSAQAYAPTAQVAAAHQFIGLPPPPPAPSRRAPIIAGAVALVLGAGVTFAIVRSSDKSAAPTVDARAVVAADAAPPPPDAAVEVAPPVDAAVKQVPPDAGSGSEVAVAVAMLAVTAPVDGELTAFLTSARAVSKGDKLFQITRVDGDPAKLRAATAKLEQMKKLAKKDPIYEAFVAEATADLAKLRRVSTVVVRAERAGMATPKARFGSVRRGQLLAEIQ